MARTQVFYRLVNAETGAVIARRVERASGIWRRTVGLLGRSGLQPGEGLALEPCNGVHTFGMRFPLDILVLDRDGRVLRAEAGVLPNRVVAPTPGGRTTLELGPGTLQSTIAGLGDRLTLVPLG
jgi:hypothetical protein